MQSIVRIVRLIFSLFNQNPNALERPHCYLYRHKKMKTNNISSKSLSTSLNNCFLIADNKAMASVSTRNAIVWFLFLLNDLSFIKNIHISGTYHLIYERSSPQNFRRRIFVATKVSLEFIVLFILEIILQLNGLEQVRGASSSSCQKSV